MKNYLKRNFPPLLAELAFLACCFLLPSEQILYANTLFYTLGGILQLTFQRPHWLP